MKRIFTWIRGHKILSTLILALVGGVLYYTIAPQKPDIEYITEKAQVRELQQTVSVTGTLTTQGSVDLNFNAVGDIAHILVKVGDVVQEGDLLAELKNTALQNSIKEAQARVASQQAQLEKVIQGAKDEEVQVAYTQLKNAQQEHEALKVTFTAEIQALEQEIANARVALADTQTSAQLTITNARQNVLLSLQKSLNIASNAILGVDKVTTSNDISTGFGLKDQNAKFHTESLLEQLPVEVTSASLAFDELGVIPTQSEIERVALQIATLLQRTNLLLNYAIDAVEGTLMVGTYTVAKQLQDIQTLQTHLSSVNAMQIELTATKQSYATALTQQPITIRQQEFALDTLISNLATKKASHELQLAQATSKIATAQAQYDLTRSKATSADIKIAQAQVSQAVAAVDVLKEQLTQYQIVAPFDGVVAKVSFKENEAVTSAQKIITLLGDEAFDIEVLIPESDITKVQVGSPALITLDAYGDDVVFNGRIEVIEPSETIIQEVVYYKVIMSIEESEYVFKSGMTANVDIIAQQKKGSIVIPSRAVVTQDDGTKVVRIKRGDDILKVQVNTGIRGDGGYVEIISGLEAGDEVIVFERAL